MSGNWFDGRRTIVPADYFVRVVEWRIGPYKPGQPSKNHSAIDEMMRSNGRGDLAGRKKEGDLRSELGHADVYSQIGKKGPSLSFLPDPDERRATRKQNRPAGTIRHGTLAGYTHDRCRDECCRKIWREHRAMTRRKAKEAL